MQATQLQAQTGVRNWIRVSSRGEHRRGGTTDPGIDPSVSFDYESSEAEANTKASSIQWACVVRDEILLVVAPGGELPEKVSSTARQLLNKKPTVGWDSYQESWRGGLKGLKFHVYQEGAGEELIVWIFACVYVSSRISKRQAQSFLEKIVVISEMWREADDSWKEGGHMACQDFFAPVLQQRMQEFSYLGDMAVADSVLDLSQEIVATNRSLVKRMNRDNKVPASQEEALLRKMEELNREVLAQDLKEQQKAREEELVKQMEEMNKEILSATNESKVKEGQTPQEEDELDKVWRSGSTRDSTSGVASFFKDFVTPIEPAEVTFDESESSEDGEDGYLGDGAMTAVLRFHDDDLAETKKGQMDESETSKTSAESSSSNQGEEKVTEFAFLLDDLEYWDATEAETGTTEADYGEDILLGKLDYEGEGQVPLTRVERIDSMLGDLEGDVSERVGSLIVSDVLVDSSSEDTSVLTEIPVEPEGSSCFLFTLFSSRNSALA
jgi:hypothetical protein